MSLSYFPHFIVSQTADQSLPYRRQLRCDPPSDPDVHLDEPRRLDLFDVNSVTMVEDRKVRSQAGAVDNIAQVRNGQFSQRHTLHRLATQTEDAHPKGMFPSLFVAVDISSRDQGTQQVTG